MSLVVVGSVAFDAIETPFGQTDKIIGGAGTYISLASSFFCNQPKIVSVVGGDFPESYIHLLQEYNINTDGLQVKEQEKTFFWSGRYHTNMNERDTLVTELNVLADFDPILPNHYKKAEYLMLGNLSPVVQRKVIEQMPERPKLIVMDTMNFWMDSCWEELLKTIALVDVLTINDSEARQLSGEYSLPKAAQKILEMGPKFLIIKKGEHGALLFHGKEIFYAPALPLEEVFDPTGAGDTFAGGFIGYMARCGEVNFENMKKALVAGSAMASFCVERFGTEMLLDLNDERIQNRIQQFVELTRFNLDFYN